MSINDSVSEQLKQAMRDRDTKRTSALRNIRAGFLMAMKEDGSATLEDPRAVEVLRRLAKQRAESIEAYTSGGREDLASEERTELIILESFLPRLADAAQTRAWVEEAIASTGAQSARERGKVMAALMKAHKADLDGKIATQNVSELLP